MILVDGKALSAVIAEEVKTTIEKNDLTLKMSVITCDPNFETKKYLALKQAKAESLGIELKTIVLPKGSDTETIIRTIKEQSEVVNGIIVQLPLPDHIDTKTVLQAIPKTLDVDAFGYEGEETGVLPPVVGAIDEISKSHNLSWVGKKVVIFGHGLLVGAPALKYVQAKGATAVVLTKESTDLSEVSLADVIILGVGKPNLLIPDMVKDGVAVFDAGASEDGGLLVGDADLQVADKASLFTPVPGGIGPLTVSLLFRNLLRLGQRS